MFAHHLLLLLLTAGEKFYWKIFLCAAMPEPFRPLDRFKWIYCCAHWPDIHISDQQPYFSVYQSINEKCFYLCLNAFTCHFLWHVSIFFDTSPRIIFLSMFYEFSAFLSRKVYVFLAKYRRFLIEIRSFFPPKIPRKPMRMKKNIVTCLLFVIWMKKKSENVK